MTIKPQSFLNLFSGKTFLQTFTDKELIKKDFQLNKQGDKNARSIPYTEESLNQLLLFNQQGVAGLYFTPNGFGGSDSRTKSNVTVFRAFCGDLDLGGEGSHITEEDKDKLEEHLTTLAIPPSYIIRTKNGLQPLWLISPTPNNPEKMEEYHNIQKGIIDWSITVGCKGDGTWSCERVLRLPGSYHNKNEQYLITVKEVSGKQTNFAKMKSQFPHDESWIIKDIKAQDEILSYYKGSSDLLSSVDIKNVVIRTIIASKKYSHAEFLPDGRLVVGNGSDLRVSGAFQLKKDDGQAIASTSHDIPSGNKITFVAKMLGIDNKDAWKWLKAEFNLKTEWEIERDKKQNLLASKNVEFNEVIKIFEKNFVDPDMDAVRVAIASVLSFHLSESPVWMFLVAPASSMKTEIVNSMRYLPKTYSLGTLTPSTFLSGYDQKGKKPKDKKATSLLHRLGKEAMLLNKDFTTLLSEKSENLVSVLSQLRDIYDGSTKKDFGTGETVEWEGKIGFLSGVTDAIDAKANLRTVFGERFLNYRLPSQNPHDIMNSLFNSHSKLRTNQEENAIAVRHYFNSININTDVDEINIPLNIQTKVSNLAQFLIRARAGIPRDNFRGEREYDPVPEGIARVGKQIILLIKCLAIMDKRSSVDMSDYRIVAKVGIDSVSKQRISILNYLLTTTDSNKKNASAIAERIGYRKDSTMSLLRDLSFSGINLISCSNKYDSFLTSDKETYDKNEWFYSWDVSDITKSFIEKMSDPGIKTEDYNYALLNGS